MPLRQLALVCILGLLAACDPADELPALSADAVILAFGNSLTRGTGAASGEGYPEQLAVLSGLTVVNAGIPGEESDAGLARLPVVLARVAPDLVILGHGGNDMLRRRDLGETKANLRQMVELAREAGAAVVLLGVPRLGLFLGVHPMYLELAAELEIPVEDEVLSDVLGDPALKSDQIHPNAAGYRRLALAIHQLLMVHGALGPPVGD